jgi:hypothetical protein
MQARLAGWDIRHWIGRRPSRRAATLQLAWAVFYGIATLAIAPVYDGPGRDRWIRVAFLLNGGIGIAVGMAFALGGTTLLPLAIAGLIVASVALPLDCTALPSIGGMGLILRDNPTPLATKAFSPRFVGPGDRSRACEVS